LTSKWATLESWRARKTWAMTGMAAQKKYPDELANARVESRCSEVREREGRGAGSGGPGARPLVSPGRRCVVEEQAEIVRRAAARDRDG